MARAAIAQLVERIHGKDEVSGSSPDRGSIFIFDIMIKVAKVLIRNDKDQFLVVYRNNHPIFGNSIDIPGGIVETEESLEAGAIRELHEELGLTLAVDQLSFVVSTTKYSRIHNEFNLYETTLSSSPKVTLSWEHTSHAWLDAATLIEEARTGSDRFVHMVADHLDEASSLNA